MASTSEFADVVKHWTEALSPANPVEEHLTTAIARQDFLMYALLKRVTHENQTRDFPKWMRTHRDMAETLESLTRTLDTLQRKRLAQEPPRPPSLPKAKAKVIAFPSRPTASVGRPRKIALESEPYEAPDLARQRKSRAETPKLDLKIAA